MDIIQSPLFERQYNQLEEDQQEAIETIIREISLDPTLGYQRKGTLKEFWSYSYQDSRGRMELTYRFKRKYLIEIVAVYKISQFI